jgi:hypothetical protein
VARDAVAEVDGPGEIAGRAVGVVSEAGEEASDASDGDAEGERDGVEVSGGTAQSDIAFGEFDGDEAEGECADDGFAAEEVAGVVQVVPGELRVFEPVEELGAECGSGDGRRYDGPAERSDERIPEAAAQREVDCEGDEVGECFKEEVGMDGIRAEVKVVGEDGRGMGWGDDGEL